MYIAGICRIFSGIRNVGNRAFWAQKVTFKIS